MKTTMITQLCLQGNWWRYNIETWKKKKKGFLFREQQKPFAEIKVQPGFIPGGPWFNSSGAPVHSQLTCFLPVGIFNPLS